jgi:selenide,water dikinase
MRGGAEIAAQAGCFVAGGHTIDDPVPKYGLAVTGLAHPDRLMTIDRAAPGDRLILTKAIGTGVVATALKRDGASAAVVEAAVASMTLLNAGASQAALAAGVRAATDVTGFGLLGHLHRMLVASRAAARLYAADVPLLPGAADLAAAGFVSGGTRANTERMRGHAFLDPAVPACSCTMPRPPVACCWRSSPPGRPPCSATCGPRGCPPRSSARSPRARAGGSRWSSAVRPKGFRPGTVGQ